MNALPFYVEPTDPPSKQELLKAALKLFARDGVRESSIRAVAEEAGFTNPVLFKYFEGKDALALYLFERSWVKTIGLLGTLLVYLGGPALLLDYYLNRFDVRRRGDAFERATEQWT